MLDEHVDIIITCSGFQAVEDVAEILAEIILNERAGFEFQRAEIADCTQLCGQVDLQEIPCNIRLRQELPERGIVGGWVCCFSSSSTLALKNDPKMLSQPGKS